MKRQLRYNIDIAPGPSAQSLYKWAIQETDSEGREIGSHQIPWGWTLYFTATSCSAIESLIIKDRSSLGERKVEEPTTTQPMELRMQLRPGRKQGDGSYFRETSYSMFGTDREIADFSLVIYPLENEEADETCKAIGSVAYLAEADFQDIEIDDCVCFYLSVKPSLFNRYMRSVARGEVDAIVFSASLVSGFYSAWSPMISTDKVKVLTRDKEHHIQVPDEFESNVRRLGDVGEASVSFFKHSSFAGSDANSEQSEKNDESTAAEVNELSEITMNSDSSELIQLFRSVRRAAWFGVAILVFALTVFLVY